VKPQTHAFILILSLTSSNSNYILITKKVCHFVCVSETPSSAMLNIKILESQSTKKLSGTTQSNSLSRIDKQQQRPQLHVRLAFIFVI
jgi:hypothetical protein